MLYHTFLNWALFWKPVFYMFFGILAVASAASRPHGTPWRPQNTSGFYDFLSRTKVNTAARAALPL